jgi:hypothetical protein
VTLLLLLDGTSTPEPEHEAPVVVTPVAPEPPIARLSYYAYDLLTGNFIGQVPLRGVGLGEQLNTAGSLSGTIDLQDPRVRETNPLSCTIPNRTFIVADYGGAIVGSGIVMTRKWSVTSSPQNTTRVLEISCSGLWAYFQSRVQATDYSAPPFSGITGASPMAYWTATPWDSSLVGCQIVADAIGFADGASEPFGNPLGGLGVMLNGAPPSGASPVAPASDFIAVSYPFTSMQTVDTIVTQLSQLGLGVGFDFGVDVAYSKGPGSPLIATVNFSYPRRGRTVAQNNLMIDLTTARSYEFPEDGTQTANQIYELGGSGAIVVTENVNPLDQGYPLWERVLSHANAQSQNITSLLSQIGTSDLATYSYAPVSPTVSLGLFDPNLPLGSFIVGDDVQLALPARAPDGGPFDPRFPAGLSQEWRITGWKADVKDEGDSLLTLTLTQPPYLEALTPAV